MNELLKRFRCRHPSGECLIDLHKGLTEEYRIEGARVLFRGTQIGDLSEKPLEEIICGTHCNDRFLDEVLGVPDDRQRLRVVKKYSIPRHQLEEDDF